MEKLIFEKGKVEDIEKIFKIFRSAILEMEKNGIMQWDEIYPDITIIENDLKNEDLSVGKINNEIAVAYTINKNCFDGYINGNWSYKGDKYIVLHRICVNPKFQNNNIGSRTITHIEGTLKKSGTESIRLDAFPKNPYAIKMYQKLGYKNVGDLTLRKGAFILMEKIL
ncbi:MAG: GNAT family N-acetyltransferase [Fusobacteriaceae bacterium]|jgi:ribosomal protein S18 acetylase RimI-like enzyme|nr:GNAT family N-acetyltransferase [Fusobacteriaceae bacterium]